MTGFNLPPGCSVRDLPGNRPEDEAAEAFIDAFYDAAKAAEETDPTKGELYLEKLSSWAWDRMGDAWGDGYQRGQSDAAMAAEKSVNDAFRKGWESASNCFIALDKWGA